MDGYLKSWKKNTYNRCPSHWEKKKKSQVELKFAPAAFTKNEQLSSSFYSITSSTIPKFPNTCCLEYELINQFFTLLSLTILKFISP